MSNPHVTYRELLGHRIYSVETPAGFVHFVATEIFEHESEAVRVVKGVPVNPVVAAMEEQANKSDEVLLAEIMQRIDEYEAVTGDVSGPEREE